MRIDIQPPPLRALLLPRVPLPIPFVIEFAEPIGTFGYALEPSDADQQIWVQLAANRELGERAAQLSPDPLIIDG